LGEEKTLCMELRWMVSDTPVQLLELAGGVSERRLRARLIAGTRLRSVPPL